MNNKKISIVGGGFSGCVSAFLLSKLGYDVTLFEKGEKLGGTSSDIIKDKEFYFNGPHYYFPETYWVKELMSHKEFKDEFENYICYDSKTKKEFNFHGSYTDIFGKIEVSKFFAHPITSEPFENISELNEINALEKRIDSYQANIASSLKKWLKKHSLNFKKLHFNCAELLNIGRICFIKDLEKIKSTKKNSNYADYVLGVPRKKSNLERKICFPKNGNDAFYQKFYSLLNKKIKIKLNSKVKIECKDKKNINISNNGKNLETDYIIWAANPVYILKDLGYGLLDNPFVKVKVYCAEVELIKNLNFENFYIQVFSLKSNIFRIYFYKTGKSFKITVETFFDKKEKSINQEHLKMILSHFKFNFKVKGTFFEKKEVRHYLMTSEDFKRFIKFDKDFKNTSLINGGWHLFGRENKIEHIMKNFSK
tara:strand:+ start:12768 stop:14036 length:1269 start_codon:yes stop_codon:yes gene_type:complete